MNIDVTAVDVCAGSSHIEVAATVDGRSENFRFTRQSLGADPDDKYNLARARIRSAIKEAGAVAGGAAALRTLLIGRALQA